MFQLGMSGLLGSLGAVSKVVLLLLFVFSVVSWAIIFLKWRAFATADRMDQQFMGLLAKAKDLDDLCRQVRRMVRHESVVTALIGAVLGIAVGLFLAALATTALSETLEDEPELVRRIARELATLLDARYAAVGLLVAAEGVAAALPPTVLANANAAARPATAATTSAILRTVPPLCF